MNVLNNSKYNLLADNTFYIMRTLVDQTEDYFVNIKFKIKSHKYISYAIIIIWILSASILTKCFTSILLGIYSTQKPYPLVYTLQDIIDNKDIKIGGRHALNKLSLYNKDYYDLLDKRFITGKTYNLPENFINSNVIFLNRNLIQDLLDGKVVMFYDSEYMDRVRNIYVKHWQLFSVSESKYMQMYMSYTMSRNIIFQKDILFRYKIL